MMSEQFLSHRNRYRTPYQGPLERRYHISTDPTGDMRRRLFLNNRFSLTENGS